MSNIQPAPPPEQLTVDLLVPHARLPQVLLVGDEREGWRLPSVSGSPPWRGGLPQMLASARASLGLKLALLRGAAGPSDMERTQGRFVYELDSLGGVEDCPPGARWVDRAALAGMRLAQPEQAGLIERLLGALERGERERRSPPWSRPGWLREASAWMAEQLAALGRPLSAPVEQIKCWSISSVLRGQTAAGEVYLKVSAALPLFVDEPAMLAALARLYPAHVPAPLCVEPRRRWMLLEAFDRVIGHGGSAEDREGMLRAFGRIQRESAEHIPQLLEAGCLDRRLEVLARQIEPLAADGAALEGLEEQELARFRALVPALQRRCAELAECGLPATLLHGDLHLNNVGLKAGRYQFFDWSDACIGHPMLDLVYFYHEKDAALQQRLRDAYLEVWDGLAPPGELLRAFELARPLSDLHQAVSFQYINGCLEDAALVDFRQATAGFVRRALKALEGENG